MDTDNKTRIVHDWSTGELVISEIELTEEEIVVQATPAGEGANASTPDTPSDPA